MKKLIVSALAVIGLGLAQNSELSAQRVRAGATVGLVDKVGVMVSYGVPYDRPVWVRWDLRDRSARYWQARLRHHRAHRQLYGRHDRWHREIEREHELLHRDIRLGYVSPRDHRRWHDAVGYDHDDLHDEIDHRHDRFHKRSRGGRGARHSH